MGEDKTGRWWIHTHDATPQTDPGAFTDDEIMLEVKHLIGLNKRLGSHPLRTRAYLDLLLVVEGRKAARAAEGQVI